MPVINILSPHVADLIAAGEVVERPGSVVKELLENSFDAGAKNVTVELHGGGMTYIRVTDDGCGMSPEDAGVAFLRHATSKLHDERGLEAIGTMGFRGEALAAISAVSRIELLTRQKGAEHGTRVVLEAGDITDMCAFGCPEGTTIIVRDLFYNTPARLKFLKSDKAEASSCVNLALRCALGRPEISVRCIRDGRDEFFSPGDGLTESCIYSLLGRDIASAMLPCKSGDDAVSVRGFVSSPAAGRGNRAMQFFFCNGRCIRSATLQTALERAYRNTLLTGRFPSCVLYIDLSPASVDVNVHPTKAEVKFTDERKVFDGVYYAVSAALEKERFGVSVSLSGSAKAEPKDDFFRRMTAKEFAASPLSGSGKGSASAPAKHTAPRQAANPAPEIVIDRRGAAYAPSGNSVRSPGFVYSSSKAQYTSPAVNPEHSAHAVPAASIKAPEAHRAPDAVPVQVSEPASEPAAPMTQISVPEFSPAPDVRVIGEALGTYIVAEFRGELLLIDKHAAHERIIFDRLRADGSEIMSQSLLLPLTFSPGEGDVELLLKNSVLLSELGFEIDEYGEGSLAVRAVPADILAEDAVSALEELCEKLRTSSVDPTGVRDELLHTVACKAAIKAGRSSDVSELYALASAVASGEVKYCPHGRPVSVTLTKKELDKQFRRIV